MPFPYSLHVDDHVNRIIGGIQSWPVSVDENEVLLDALKFAERAGFFREAKEKALAEAKRKR